MLQFMIHYGLHLLLPAFISWKFFRRNWKKSWAIMLGTMMIDLDHLLADPIFDANRCSIGFHPLHSYYAIFIYFITLLFLIKTTTKIKNQLLKIITTGLMLHIAIDYQDCLWIE